MAISKSSPRYSKSNTATATKTSSTGSTPKGLQMSEITANQAGSTRESRASNAVDIVNKKQGINLPGGTAPLAPVAPEMATPGLSPALQPPQPTAGVPSPQESLAKAQASGIPAPQDSAEARQAVAKFTPPPSSSFYKPTADSAQVYDATGKPLSYDQYIQAGGKADFSNVQSGLPDTAVTQQIEADPDYQAVLQAKKEYNDVINQRKSLTDEYTAISKKLGIDGLNTELMNMANIIDGTDEDIRNEVTKAGGFATESQVQALGSARNKQLVKNYNNLLETKQMAMETLNTMIGLAGQDRQFAQQAALQKLNIEQEILSYKDKMKTNATSAYDDIINKIGYEGLYLSLGGDPWHTALVEKTLGMKPGQLKKLGETKEDPKAVKFETVTIGSGKNNVKVRYGYDSSGNIVSKTNLNTGQPFNSAPQVGATYRAPARPKPPVKTKPLEQGVYGPPVPTSYKPAKAPAKKNTIDDLFNSL